MFAGEDVNCCQEEILVVCKLRCQLFGGEDVSWLQVKLLVVSRRRC